MYVKVCVCVCLDCMFQFRINFHWAVRTPFGVIMCWVACIRCYRYTNYSLLSALIFTMYRIVMFYVLSLVYVSFMFNFLTMPPKSGIFVEKPVQRLIQIPGELKSRESVKTNVNAQHGNLQIPIKITIYSLIQKCLGLDVFIVPHSHGRRNQETSVVSVVKYGYRPYRIYHHCFLDFYQVLIIGVLHFSST